MSKPSHVYIRPDRGLISSSLRLVGLLLRLSILSQVQTIYELAQAHAVTYMPIATVKPIAGMSPVLVATAAGSDRAPPPTMLFTKLHVAHPIDVPAGADTCAAALAGVPRGRRPGAIAHSTQATETQFFMALAGLWSRCCLPALRMLTSSGTGR